jgi:hypothetical protein
MSVFIQDGVATLLFIAAAALLLQQTLGVVRVRPATRRCAACHRGQCTTAPARPALGASRPQRPEVAEG